MAPPDKPLTRRMRRRFIEHIIHVINLYLWPFYAGEIVESPRLDDTEEKLARRFGSLGPRIEETTHEYLPEVVCGQLLPKPGQPLPECPITIEAEQQFFQHLKELSESYTKTRRNRRPAVLRKISHAVIAWWGITYGAWQGTENQFTIEMLSWEEAADLYNSFCFADCKEHTPEQVRKLTTRLIERIKDCLPRPNRAISAVSGGTATNEDIDNFMAFFNR